MSREDGGTPAVGADRYEEAFEGYVGAKPLPPEHRLDNAECHNCGEPWDGGDDWGERHIRGGASAGETWKYECPGCGHETFEVGT